MAKPFSKILDTSLGLEDRLTFGKFRGLRISDIIKDEYHYIFWLNKQTFCKLKEEVLIEARACQADADYQEYVDQEQKPWLNENPWFSDDLDDVPF